MNLVMNSDNNVYSINDEEMEKGIDPEKLQQMKEERVVDEIPQGFEDIANKNAQEEVQVEEYTEDGSKPDVVDEPVSTF